MVSLCAILGACDESANGGASDDSESRSASCARLLTLDASCAPERLDDPLGAPATQWDLAQCDSLSVDPKVGDLVVLDDGSAIRKVTAKDGDVLTVSPVKPGGPMALLSPSDRELFSKFIDENLDRDLEDIEVEGTILDKYEEQVIHRGENITIKAYTHFDLTTPKLDYDFDFNVGRLELTKFKLILSARVSTQVRVKFEARTEEEEGGPVSWSTDIALLELGVQDVPFGQLLRVATDGRVSATLGTHWDYVGKAEAWAGFDIDASTEFGPQYTKEGGWSFVREGTFEPTLKGPVLEALGGSLDGKLWLDLEMDAKLFSTFGGQATLSPYVSFNVSGDLSDDADALQIESSAEVGVEGNTEWRLGSLARGEAQLAVSPVSVAGAATVESCPEGSSNALCIEIRGIEGS